MIRCFKFELRIVARVTRNFDGSIGPGWYARGNETYQVAAKVPLAIVAPGGGAVEALSADLVGAGPVTYTVVANTGSGAVDFGAIGNEECTYQSTGNTRPGLADVTQAGLGLGIRGSDVKRILDPFTVLSLGDPQEEINASCQGTVFGQPSSSNENEWQRNFMRWWQLAHQSEETNAQNNNSNPDGPWSGPWLVRFKQTPWPKIGTYSGDFTYQDQGVRVTDLWEFVHTPPPKRAG